MALQIKTKEYDDAWAAHRAAETTLRARRAAAAPAVAPVVPGPGPEPVVAELKAMVAVLTASVFEINQRLVSSLGFAVGLRVRS